MNPAMALKMIFARPITMATMGLLPRFKVFRKLWKFVETSFRIVRIFAKRVALSAGLVSFVYSVIVAARLASAASMSVMMAAEPGGIKGPRTVTIPLMADTAVGIQLKMSANTELPVHAFIIADDPVAMASSRKLPVRLANVLRFTNSSFLIKFHDSPAFLSAHRTRRVIFKL